MNKIMAKQCTEEELDFIGKYANNILLLYRVSGYNPDADPDDLEIIVAKNSSGRSSIKCSFKMETGILKAID